MKYSACGWLCVIAAFPAGCSSPPVPVALPVAAPAASETAAPDYAGWTLVFEENFSDDSWPQRWRLEGFADLGIVRDGEADYLKIRTVKSAANRNNKQSVLWCKRRFSGNLRFVFRARGQSGNRSIFYFNANTTADSKLSSIFDLPRPDAQMVRYAGVDELEMYSVGILRDDQDRCNVRYLGGAMAECFRKQTRFGAESIIQSHDSPYRHKPQVWFKFDLRVVGPRITMEVDGVTVVDFEDSGNVGTDAFGWAPLDDGGFFAFRDFMPRQVDIDYVRVYRRNRGVEVVGNSAD
ncbi:MAG: DUF1080 domain-containing protein [Planctomycetes bacterium]|nr:DUF1080 domain-containing protein [Planctomycetota bacterium]